MGVILNKPEVNFFLKLYTLVSTVILMLSSVTIYFGYLLAFYISLMKTLKKPSDSSERTSAPSNHN